MVWGGVFGPRLCHAGALAVLGSAWLGIGAGLLVRPGPALSLVCMVTGLAFAGASGRILPARSPASG